MVKIYEVESKKSLHDIMFETWEQYPIVFINGWTHSTQLENTVLYLVHLISNHPL